MTVTWIGTRTQHEGVFNPAGIARAQSGAPVGLELLTRGSLMLEVEVRPRRNPVNLLRFAALDPWPCGVTLCLEPDGTLRLLMRQGSRHLETALRTRLGAKVLTAHITYVWDAPARRGQLSVHVPDHGLMWQTDVVSPFPMALRDVKRIMTEPGACTMDAGVTFAAVANAPCPLGPQPGLLGNAAVDTPTGPREVRHLAPGDLIETEGRGAMPVIWSGPVALPALGRFAPMTLRRPYLGLWEDLITSRDQRVCLSGSEVEYLFGEERVTTAVRHLEARNCAVPTKPIPAVVTYHQVLLESHEIITVNGAAVESFDGSAVLGRPEWIAGSVFADMPSAVLPRRVGLAAPVLQGFEALTLTGVSIG